MIMVTCWLKENGIVAIISGFIEFFSPSDISEVSYKYKLSEEVCLSMINTHMCKMFIKCSRIWLCSHLVGILSLKLS